MSEELVDFFKALADSSRLKIVGLLAQQPYTVEELAALLNLKPSTISHHLARLSEAGLVSAKAEGYYSVYQLEEKALEAKSRSLFTQNDLDATVADIDLGAYDNKVIADFTRSDGRLKTIPVQHRKLEAILRYIVQKFKPGRHYSEKEVNEILAHFYKDTAALRRELIANGLMQCENGGDNYWRTADKRK
jgi:predicted transcriptional regulator